eukprot:TRINITY_DN62749_c0_g1_i1.p1 TRINITY_DN62749_c0_g1~~TRINITY_DN62749_c0_g1_i1.p1  ORF type:complete len:565 (+),score=110.34 TRINITY_DN62749_c0_g1_i1:89-1783(+)
MVKGPAEIIGTLQCQTDEHWKSRQTAVSDLEKLSEDESPLALGLLKGIISDSNRRVRYTGVHALGQLSRPSVWGRTPGKFAGEAIPELTRCLADPDPSIRKFALEPLRTLKESGQVGNVVVHSTPALPDILVSMKDEDWRVRESGGRVLMQLEAFAIPALPQIVEMLLDDSAQCREMAKRCMESLLDRGFFVAEMSVAVPIVAALLRKKLTGAKDWKVRVAAAWACSQGILGPLVNVHKVVSILKNDRDLPTRLAAVEVLGAIGLAAAPTLSELTDVMLSGPVKTPPPLKAAVVDLVLAIRTEMVEVIGRAIHKHREVKEAIDEAQRIATRIGKETEWERKDAIERLSRPVPHHAGAVTELLRVLLDPTCPGAAQGPGSEVMCADGLLKFRENGSLGGIDVDGQGAALARTLMDRLQDKNWRVRLACADALANLAAQLQQPAQRLQNRLEGEDRDMQMGAQRLMRLLGQAGAFLEPDVLATAAAESLRRVLKTDWTVRKTAPDDLLVARKVAREAIQRLVQAKLTDSMKSDDAWFEMEEQRLFEERRRATRKKTRVIHHSASAS